MSDELAGPGSLPRPVAPPVPTIAAPSVETSRHLLGASFDLLSRAQDEMRRASFYIGAVALGLIGPVALGAWLLEAHAVHLTDAEAGTLLASPAGVWFGLLFWPATIGVLVVAVESRIMAAAILGGRMVGRPISPREALARSRMVFWRAIAAGLLSGIPLAIVQELVGEAVDSALPSLGGQASVLSSTVVAALVGAPLAYLLTGVVLGDVPALEALRRSIVVFRARKGAAVLVALFETVAVLLILFGLSAGLELALRFFGALGLGADSGPAGLLLVTFGLAAGTFALGTLVYTVTAIALAPQVVMFVGLTHATMGLDHVRADGDRSPDVYRSGQRPFRIMTRPMRAAIILGWLAFLVLVAQLGR